VLLVVIEHSAESRLLTVWFRLTGRLITCELDSEGSPAAAATPPKKNVRTYYCSKNHHADSYRHLCVPFLVDRILRLATTNVAVNLTYGGDFSLCVASIATHFNIPLIVPVIAG
jgi:hypothetical protein